eukprot:scaffold159866_cov36-Tisochrysis_lutea.AAC.1
MERAAATPLSFGPPAEGAPSVPMEGSLAKQQRPRAEAEQVSATPSMPHGLWPRPHHTHSSHAAPPHEGLQTTPDTQQKKRANPPPGIPHGRGFSKPLATAAPPRRRSGGATRARDGVALMGTNLTHQ